MAEGRGRPFFAAAACFAGAFFGASFATFLATAFFAGFALAFLRAAIFRPSSLGCHARESGHPVVTAGSHLV
ncbi:MAG: hypothetical protein GEU91_12090 [Rhizobiales bacterium]|nr:hypothetical protein [Hyphomicrobiales bacterium]